MSAVWQMNNWATDIIPQMLKAELTNGGNHQGISRHKIKALNLLFALSSRPLT